MALRFAFFASCFNLLKLIISLVNFALGRRCALPSNYNNNEAVVSLTYNDPRLGTAVNVFLTAVFHNGGIFIKQRFFHFVIYLNNLLKIAKCAI